MILGRTVATEMESFALRLSRGHSTAHLADDLREAARRYRWTDWGMAPYTVEVRFHAAENPLDVDPQALTSDSLIRAALNSVQMDVTVLAGGRVVSRRSGAPHNL